MNKLAPRKGYHHVGDVLVADELRIKKAIPIALLGKGVKKKLRKAPEGESITPGEAVFYIRKHGSAVQMRGVKACNYLRDAFEIEGYKPQGDTNES